MTLWMLSTEAKKQMGQVPQLEKLWSGLLSLAQRPGPSPLHKVRDPDEANGRFLLKKTCQFALDIIEECEKLPRTTNDLLNSLLILHDQRPTGFTRRDLIAASYISLYVRVIPAFFWMMLMSRTSVTAHDVLAISLRAVLYYLAKNPAMRAKVRAEIRDAELTGKLSQATQQRETSDLEYV